MATEKHSLTCEIPAGWSCATIHDQATADAIIPRVLSKPATGYMVWIDGITGPVDITVWLWGREIACKDCPLDIDCECNGEPRIKLDGEDAISFVRVSGGRGDLAVPCHPQWIRDLRDQCAAAGVAFRFDSWGDFIPYEQSAQPPFLESQHGDEIDGHILPDVTEHEEIDGWYWPEILGPLYRRVGAAASGRLLDGVEHLDAPPAGVVK